MQLTFKNAPYFLFHFTFFFQKLNSELHLLLEAASVTAPFKKKHNFEWEKGFKKTFSTLGRWLTRRHDSQHNGINCNNTLDNDTLKSNRIKTTKFNNNRHHAEVATFNVMLRAVMLSVAFFVAMLCAVVLSFALIFLYWVSTCKCSKCNCNVKYRCAEWPYAECHYAECRCAK